VLFQRGRIVMTARLPSVAQDVQPETLEELGITTFLQLQRVVQSQGLWDQDSEAVKSLPESWKNKKIFLKEIVGPDQAGISRRYYLWWSGSRWLTGSEFL